ncbi:hypothetical protein CARUB_v10015333mg [Capsella rubella]|uniref:SHSP domain-containing protein n=1 Tax=Capsella rubella TaxID=81985 RepID=R0G987_9BRAS|nr:trichohyalin [Capsella rubella]EOA32086.1 hypothetical protein CARUB_v10015333mg [Capsella rubella]
MAAMFRRPKPGGGSHPPPLAPTVSSFKPRAQWTNSGSSIFLYVNLPGFYRDQISIKMDVRTRTVQIQGQRPLSTQTKARFNEAYRVPESCDMSKLSTSFSHGLLTIEFQAIVEGVQDQGKIGQRSNQEKSGPNGSTLGRKKPLIEEKQVGTSEEKPAPTLNKEEPKTYKSVVEGKRTVPTGNVEKSEPKVKAGEAIPKVRGKESAKEAKVVERKGATQMSQQKTGQKLKEEEARSTPTLGGSLKLKERAKEEKVVERKEAPQIGQQKIGQKVKEEEAKRSPALGASSIKAKVRAIEEKASEGKKDADISQNKTGQMVKEKEIISRSPAVDTGLKPKVHANLVGQKGDGEIGQKLKEEGNIKLGQKEQEKYTKPVVGDEARRTEKMNQAESQLKTKERDERTELDADDGLRNNQDEKKEIVGDMVSEGEIQERVEQKKIGETSLAKYTGEHEDNAGQTKNSMDSLPAAGGNGKGEEDTRTYDVSLVNVGAAALVIMGFGAYVFVPLVKYFS